MYFSVALLSPKHITDSIKTTFKKRPGNKHIYQQCMMVAMLANYMANGAFENCQFMYTKRMFQWTMEEYSFYNTINVRRKTNWKISYIFEDFSSLDSSY